MQDDITYSPVIHRTRPSSHLECQLSGTHSQETFWKSYLGAAVSACQKVSGTFYMVINLCSGKDVQNKLDLV